MSTAKGALRAAKAAIDAHQYGNAATEAKKALERDPQSYHGHVFLGVALDKQELADDSEDAYRAAIRIKGKDSLAWQGLVTLFEKQDGRKLDQYHEAALQLAEIYRDADDKIKCQSVVDKYTSDAKKYGSRAQYQRSLAIILPGSPVFEYLEGRIPHPSYLYSILADSIEVDEKEKLNLEIGQRRTRLGARIEQVTLEVKREIVTTSTLEYLYTQIIDWTSDDEIRRRYEEKLLDHAVDALSVLPISQKAEKREEVMKMAQGMVILRHPFILAWKIVLEWKDIADVASIDVTMLRDFVQLFPDDGLSKILKGYLSSDISPFSRDADVVLNGNGIADGDTAMPAEDVLILMNDGLQDSMNSVLSHRLMSQYYLHLEEYESVTVNANAGLNCVNATSNEIGYNMIESRDAINNTLATALIHYQSPRHHAQAKVLFTSILEHKSTDLDALIGIGLILEEQENFEEAISFFKQALDKSQDPKIKAESAWCKSLSGDHQTAFDGLQEAFSEIDGKDSKSQSLRSKMLYRMGMCSWSLDSSRSARKDRKRSYAYFLASVQADMNFAPSYTSLGMYYADYGKDRKRATKCFHKAFELSALEVDAAHRLAQAFATNKEWDLVEIVAQRVIELGNVRPPPGSKKKSIAWPFAALGVVQLNDQDYAKSIASFQSALRIAPDEYYCWVGLGESYHYSGRYVAAEKAFEHAQRLGDASHLEDRWFTEFMQANVKRELGEYDEAAKGYSNVLERRPTEFGVSIALLQTHVESAMRNVEVGYLGRAVGVAKEAIRAAEAVAILRTDTFNFWKLIGDACSIFDTLQGYETHFPHAAVNHLLFDNGDSADFFALSNLDCITEYSLKPSERKEISAFLPLSMKASLLARKRAVAAAAQDVQARSTAWYNLGWTEYRAYLRSQNEDEHPHIGFLRAAIECFKRAIEVEANSPEFWNALGIVTSNLSPKVSQHAFVRSLYFNEKNARTWTNLGALCLIQNDSEMAREAFIRAQSADPAYANAWLGQGLIASGTLGEAEARELFTHAFEIADGSNFLVKSQYATTTFDHVKRTAAEASELLQPLLALQQVHIHRPTNLAYHHLIALLAERIGNYEDSHAALTFICSKLENQYEVSESPLVLAQFAQAKTDLARVQLARKDFDMAAENATTALDIIRDETGSRVHDHLQLSAYMTAGLAFFFQGHTAESIDMFKGALKATSADPNIVCLLSQVLWARGGDDQREVAHDQLIDCVERHPDHVDATALLACIAALSDDVDTLEAVIADLEGLCNTDMISASERNKIMDLLGLISSVRFKAEEQRDYELHLARRSLMISPAEPHGWRSLARLSQDIRASELAALTSSRAIPPNGSLTAKSLSFSCFQTGKPVDAQRAIMLHPCAREHGEGQW